MTLILLTDFVASILVLTSVIMTLIDVAGFMYFWGLTIDTVSAILLTVSILKWFLTKNKTEKTFQSETAGQKKLKEQKEWKELKWYNCHN